MDGLYGEDATSKGGEGVRNPLVVWRDNLGRKFQHFLDKSTPHPVARWIASFVVAAIYCLRAYYIEGFYIVTYGLGIYLLNLLIGFLSPQVDPESEGPGLPSKETDEFKPFIRRLPEFKFWYVPSFCQKIRCLLIGPSASTCIPYSYCGSFHTWNPIYFLLRITQIQGSCSNSVLPSCLIHHVQDFGRLWPVLCSHVLDILRWPACALLAYKC